MLAFLRSVSKFFDTHKKADSHRLSAFLILAF